MRRARGARIFPIIHDRSTFFFLCWLGGGLDFPTVLLYELDVSTRQKQPTVNDVHPVCFFFFFFLHLGMA